MISFKTELKLNNKQRTIMAKHAGVARHAYNWGLAICQEILDYNQAHPESQQKFPSAIDLHKRLVAEIKPVYEWYYEVSKCSPQQALRDLRTAWDRCFNKIAKAPRFKKKNVKDSFYLEGNFHLKGNKIKLPKIGWVKVFEKFIPPILVKKSGSNCVISKRANRWFISYKVDFEPEKINHQFGRVGCDIGIKRLATLSNKLTFPNVKAYRNAQKRLAYLQRLLARKIKGSANYKKAQKQLAIWHYRISCIRKDAIHKLTHYLTKNHSEIVIEDLNVSGMLKNHRLASAIADCGFYEFRRQLEYKSDWYGAILHIVDRFFPSSKTCSECGEIKSDLKLKERTFNCSHCGLSIDRDLNASINLCNAVSSTV
jgi:putative transposase